MSEARCRVNLENSELLGWFSNIVLAYDVDATEAEAHIAREIHRKFFEFWMNSVRAVAHIATGGEVCVRQQ